MNYIKGTCDGREGRYPSCGATNTYITCKSRGQCMVCAAKYNKKTKTKIKTKKKTGELDVFIEIWNERPHFSQVSGKPITVFSVWCFAHILSKGAYPSYRLDKRNIYLVLPEEHVLYDNGDRGALEDDPAWKELFEIKQMLIEEHYKKKPSQ
jgi:hypothetical protein